MTEQQLQALQARLLEEKESIVASNALHEGEEELEELEGVDNHPADQGTELADEYVEQALDEQRDEELEKIDEALAAIEAGTYGTCTQCGESIPYERLEALPTALTCINHAN
ncbi:MAG: TraR/DksA C4-type zinc finger protein [Caryophanon sp.]|nr:TraR/DksA C4-type zinc finger protein [Caryophanon sp.]